MASSDSLLNGLLAVNVTGHPQSNVLRVKVDNHVLYFLKECFVCVDKASFLSVICEKKDRHFGETERKDKETRTELSLIDC